MYIYSEASWISGHALASVCDMMPTAMASGEFGSCDVANTHAFAVKSWPLQSCTVIEGVLLTVRWQPETAYFLGSQMRSRHQLHAAQVRKHSVPPTAVALRLRWAAVMCIRVVMQSTCRAMCMYFLGLMTARKLVEWLKAVCLMIEVQETPCCTS